MLNLRIAAPEETARVHAFYNDVIDGLAGAEHSPGWAKDIYPDRETLAACISRGELYIGEADGRIACAVALNAAADQTCMEIHLLAVHPDFRGRALGKAMVRFAFETAGQRGMKKLRLDVTEGNLPAEGLYTGMGFRYVKSRRDWFDETEYMDFRVLEAEA